MKTGYKVILLIVLMIIGMWLDSTSGNSQKQSTRPKPQRQEEQQVKTEEKKETETKETETVKETRPENLSEIMPYAGMPEEWINDTVMGPATSSGYSSGGKNGLGGTRYVWILGHYRVLEVQIYRKTGRVVEVYYYFPEYAWYPTDQEFLYKYDLENGYQSGTLLMPKFREGYDGEQITGDDLDAYVEAMNEKAREMYEAEHGDEEEDEPEYNDFWDFYDDHGDEFDSLYEAWDYYDSEYEP